MIRSVFRVGWNRVAWNKRLIVVAWLVNLVFALIIAIPVSRQLEATLPPTADDEYVAGRIDETWLKMYRRSLQDEQTSRMLDYSILGGAPFVEHMNNLLSGRTYEAIGLTLWRSAVSGHLVLRSISLVTMLTLAWGIVGLFFSGGFITVYSCTVRASVADFVSASARSFGAIVRLGVIGCILALIVFAVMNSWVTYGWIYRSTMDDATELPAFILLLSKNAAMLILLWLGGLVFDYAKVRLVLETRTSAILALWAGVKYCVRYWRTTVSVALLLSAISVVVMVLAGAFLERAHSSTTWTIAVVCIIQQAYFFTRMGLRAMSYATAVEVFRSNPPNDAYPLRFEL
jgi:hypothetical protein